MLSLIIAVYKNIAALELIFDTLSLQSFKNFEVIVAEDNDDAVMKVFIAAAQQKYFFPILHVSQPDIGFRKTHALNAALRLAQTDYIVFIDGDCLLHRHFLKQHYLLRENQIALFGRRVMMSEKISEKILTHENEYTRQVLLTDKKSDYKSNIKLPTLLSLLITGCGRLDAALYLPFMPAPIEKESGIWGCNWSIHKKNLYSVNGFDEDYVAAGIGEDTDIEWRLKKNGVQLKKIKFHALQYHLYHSENYSDTAKNEQLMVKKIEAGLFFCKNGLRESNEL